MLSSTVVLHLPYAHTFRRPARATLFAHIIPFSRSAQPLLWTVVQSLGWGMMRTFDVNSPRLHPSRQRYTVCTFFSRTSHHLLSQPGLGRGETLNRAKRFPQTLTMIIQLLS